MDTGVERDRDWNVVLLRVLNQSITTILLLPFSERVSFMGDASDVSKSFIYQLMYNRVALKEY